MWWCDLFLIGYFWGLFEYKGRKIFLLREVNVLKLSGRILLSGDFIWELRVFRLWGWIDGNWELLVIINVVD